MAYEYEIATWSLMYARVLIKELGVRRGVITSYRVAAESLAHCK